MKHLFGLLLLIASCGLLAGCGGGGGSSAAPTLTKASLTNQAEATGRSVTEVVPIATSFSGASAGTKAATSIGQSLLHVLTTRGSAVRRSTGSGFLSELNLYYTYTENSAGTSATFLLYTDSGFTNQVGTITINVSNATGSYPFTANLTMNLTVNGYNVSGTMNISAPSAGNATVSGKLNVGPGSCSFNLSLSSSGASGSFTVNDSDGSSATINIQPVNSNGDVDFTFSSSFHLTGTGVVHSDGSGSLTITDANGITQLTMVWNSSGNATLTYADGSTATATV